MTSPRDILLLKSRPPWQPFILPIALQLLHATILGGCPDAQQPTIRAMKHDPALHSAPPEIKDEIFRLLTLGDLKRLRQVSRLLSIATARICFECHTTTLTPGGLSCTEDLIKHDKLGGAVHHLRVVAECIPAYVHMPGAENKCVTRTGPQDQGEEAFEEGLAAARYYRNKMSACSSHEEVDGAVRSENEVLGRLTRLLDWGGRHSLVVLELDARFIVGPKQHVPPLARRITELDRRRLWARASQVYRLTMTALARSGAAIPDLRIYSNTVGCSVPSYDITVGLPSLLDAGLAPHCTLRHLALSFSTRVDHGWERLRNVYGKDIARRERRRQRHHWYQVAAETNWYEMAGVAATDSTAANKFDIDDRDIDSEVEPDAWIEVEQRQEVAGRYIHTMPQAICQDNFLGVACLIKHLTDIESLDLHMYQTLEYEAFDTGNNISLYARIFKAMASEELQLHKLRGLTLRGLCVSGDDLITFLQRHPRIHSLVLHHVLLCNRVRHRTWKAVLKEICQRTIHSEKGASLCRIFCSDLCNVPERSGASTRVATYRRESLLGDTEEVRQEWIVQGWCSKSVHAGLVLHTREFLRAELQRGHLFEGTRWRELTYADPEWLDRVDFPSGDLDTYREDLFGTTHGF